MAQPYQPPPVPPALVECFTCHLKMMGSPVPAWNCNTCGGERMGYQIPEHFSAPGVACNGSARVDHRIVH